MRSIYLAMLVASLVSGCANLAPEYARPSLPVPAAVDGAAQTSASSSMPSWQELVTDERLKKVIALAIDNNRDLRVAVLNVEKARATYRITDADRYPVIKGSGSDAVTGSSDSVTRKFTATVGMSSFEVDFFGRLKNLSDAAMESYLSTEASQRSTRLTLIAEVADAWLTLAADQQLERLAQMTWESRQKTLAMVRKQKDLGGASQLTVVQQEASTESAHDDVANYASVVEQDRNALTLLVGAAIPPELLPADADIASASVSQLVAVPAGLSSEQLLERPDIIAAEHTLKAAYADIGAARAAFFPAITLTASTGTASTALDGLFKAGSSTWAFTPGISVPIFNAGGLRASLDSAKIEKEIEVATYEKTIQTAFSEVADALSVRRVLDTRLQAQKKQVVAYEQSLKLTTALYQAGSDSYLDVLDSQRSLYTAQKSLISLQLSEQSNRITLFKVLGGH